jgi:thioesterase domain-containing protein
VTIEELAEKYIEVIKKIQVQGPYYIAGWSIGGTIAFEIVKQLEQTNREIAFFAIIDSPSPQDCSKENLPLFTIESEQNFITKYLSDREIENKMQQMTDMNDMWTLIVDYLESDHFDVEIIKKVIVEYEAHIVPNYHQLGIDELVRYLNVGRTFHNARSSYVPSSKVNTKGHFFKASESKFKHQTWNAYFKKPLKIHEIKGDHYSILKTPNVKNFVTIFSRILK